MHPDAIQRLVDAALRAREHAYAPYSRFRVGAAVLAGEQVFTGCNVENASFGLTICAERAAVSAAIAAGARRLEAVAVAGDAATPTAPCGACRQVLFEFGPTMTIILHGEHETIVQPLADLLPRAFGPEDLAAER